MILCGTKRKTLSHSADHHLLDDAIGSMEEFDALSITFESFGILPSDVTLPFARFDYMFCERGWV